MTWMSLFVLFIFGAVILGSGVMFSPAWPTRQPRIALAGTLALALVVGGAVFWAYLSGWDTLVVDYMLFALVIGIFLGGTLSGGQSRAEKRGEVLSDAEQGWTGPEDLLFFGGIALAFILPMLLWNTPLGDLDDVSRALSIKLNGSFDAASPFPDADTAVSDAAFAPGFYAISAYISGQVNVDVRTAQVSIAAVLGLVGVWLIYDLGSEVRDKRLGRTMAVALLFGFGWFNLYASGAFPSMMAMLFALAFVTYQLRYLREGSWSDLIGAGLMFGAMLISHTGVFVATAAGYVIWLAVMWFSASESNLRPTPQRWLGLAAGVPLIAALATAPYLLATGGQVLTAYQNSIAAPLVTDLRDFVMFHNPLLFTLAVIGIYYGVRRRDQITLFSIGWAVVLVVLYGFSSPVMTLPLAILGGIGLLELWNRLLRPALPPGLNRRPAAALALGMLLLVAISVLLSARMPNGLPADQFAALDWVRQNTPLEAVVLNTLPDESDWMPVFLERRTVDAVCERENDVRCETYTAPDVSYDYAVVFLSDAAAPASEFQQTLSDAELVFDNGVSRVYQMPGAFTGDVDSMTADPEVDADATEVVTPDATDTADSTAEADS